MGRERKCILCQIVYSSKQEMDEHMRSMLHHRELENLKGRDCGHECRVCQVTVVGLTDYANHISSPLHKQRVEAVEREGAGNDQEEEYFDKELVKLIEKRKELIRKEEEAAAKRAKEEEERKRQQLQQQRFNEARNYLRQKGASWDWRHSNLPQSRGFKGSNWQGAWNGGNTSGGRAQDVQEDPRSDWHNSRQGKSATWHAQEPPNFQTWNSGERAGGSLHSRDGWGSKRWDPEQFSAHQRGRAPWLSNGGSTNGVYSRNSGLNWEQTKQPLMEPAHRMDFTNEKMPLSSSFEHIESQYKQQDISQDGRSNGNQNREGPSTELDHNNGMGPKTFGSNPKLDKACRWSPYPPTNSLPHKDPHPSPLEKHPKGPPAQVRDVDLRQRRDTSLGTQPSKKPPRWDQKAEQQRTASPEHSIEEGESRKHKGSSTKSSSSSSSRRDSQTSTSSGSSKQRATKPSELPEKRLSSTSSTPKTQLSRASSQDSVQSKSSQHSGSSSKSSHSEVLPSVQEQQLAEMLRKAKETLLDKRDLSTDQRMETVLHIEEEQQVESSECKVEANKGKKSRQDRINPKVDRVTDPIRHQPGSGETVESVMSPTDNNLSLQSIQVSTSTVESPRAALSAREEEEEEEREKGTGSVAADEAMQAVDAGPGSDGDVCRGSEAQTSSGATLPTLNNKQSLPALKRDLTRHIGSKSKGGSHEPNLNIARRIRNMSGTRKGEMEKDSGLKPTLRQLISSSGSRRCVNWDQVYQEVSRKKQEQGKGMPRFGIEMVAYDQEGLSQEEEDIPLAEGFQWESLFDSQPAIAPVTPRKRSLSESSIAPDRLAANLSLFSAQTAGERASREAPCRPGRQSSEQQGSSSPTPTAAYGSRDNQEEATHGPCEAKPLRQPEGPIGALQRSDSVIGDSSSGTEQNDTLAAGKKRRAAGDIPSPEIPSLERKNKRRKIKSKKERLQVDQLLAVSLREEELSRSLQTVDNSLIQARAALQAAYIEVQRLLVVKQQVSMEMSTLRTKRIELLQGIQGNLESTAQPKVKEMEEEMTVTTEPHMPSMLSPVTDTPAPAPAPAPASCPRQASQGPLNQLQRCPTPPSFLTPGQANASTQSVVIKQEPLSPSTVNTEPDPVESTVHGPHSTTPEPPTPALNGQSVIGRRPESRKASIDPPQESLRVSAECKESSSGMDQSMERGVQVTWDRRLLPADSKPLPPLLPTSRRGSRAGALDPTASPPHESSPVHPISTQPAVPTFLPPPQPESKNGKRVRKLKKKRVLRKAQGAEQPENSDTELDGETPLTSRPVRRLRTVRRKSSTFLVSTSTPPPTGEDVDMDREEALGPVSPGTKPGQEDSDSSLEMVELPQAAPAEVVTIDTSDPEDGHMEVTVTSPLPDVHPPAPDSPVAELQKLACNEVTSTSEMEVSTIVKTCESDVQLPLTSAKVSKRSSVDMTSDPGEDDIATEGVFEGHQETVNAMQIHKGLLYTCSGDRTVRAFNLVSRKCVAVFEGHSTKVNCLVVSCGPGLQQRLYSGSSDQTIRCYSLRTRECLEQFSLPDRVLCLHSRWKVLYAGLANGTVVRFNLKTNKHMDVFECNGPRAVSCLATAQEGARRILLVGSYDSTISVRDAKNGLLLRTLEGHTKTVLCMKVVNDLVFSGSSDQSVHAHNIHTGELVRIYKGHSHAVTVVAILGKVMITACLDKLVRVYELQSHDRLQVYGGHKDMVMCMAIHNNMIYTGCYDGSVQAVKLNLIQNHRCWWHGCSLNFGVMEHLQQHVLNDHTSSNFQTLKCRWRNCDEFFTARNSSKQGVAKHMQNHAEEESKVES